MIAACLILGMAQYPPKFQVLEIPNPEAERVTVHAYLWRGERYEKEDAAWRVICKTIGDTSLTFSSSDVDFFARQNRYRPRVVGSPDFLRVEVEANPDRVREAVIMAASLVAQPNWRSNSWETEQNLLKGQAVEVWRDALWAPADHRYTMSGEEIGDVFARILERSGVRLVVSGPIEVGAAQAQLGKEAATWDVPISTRISRFSDKVKNRESQNSPVSTFELTGLPIRVGEQGSAPAFLAAIALGVGKGSSMWQVLREREGLAYRLDGVLWPTKEGFVPRFLLLRKTEEAEIKYLASMKNGLKSDAETFDDVDLRRAKMMARQVLLSPSPFGSIYTDAEAVLYGEASDDVRWRGLLNGMGLPSIPLLKWADQLDAVELAEFQKSAVEMADSATMHLTKGYVSP
jgi:hypothetical protein